MADLFLETGRVAIIDSFIYKNKLAYFMNWTCFPLGNTLERGSGRARTLMTRYRSNH